MHQETAALWDVGLKFVGLVAGALGAAWAIYAYVDTKKKEFYGAFWRKKLDLYVEVSALASRLVTTKSADSYAAAYQEYFEFFYGRLSVVEGDAVISAMQRFAGQLPRDATGKLPLNDLRDQAYLLSLALKSDLFDSWRMPFQELDQATKEAVAVRTRLGQTRSSS